MGTSPERVERRLAAILAADVAGYSRLMSEDEVGTLHALTVQREIMDRLIAEHGGRIANTAGDSVLAEFPSAVDAVQCAVAVQEKLGEADAAVPADRRLRFRIGVHLGDVAVRGGDLLGDGVNVAARLESIAEPGTVYLSETVHRFVRKALPLPYTDLGEQRVKNMDEPLRVYSLRHSSAATPRAKPKALQVPDKPSIAVLPFSNMSASEDTEFFSDGITEDIITALSRLRWLFVIARNSTFVYKGKAVDVRHVARELGVRYVLEGSVRAAGQRLRITAQLIEAETGKHIWAERYDGQLGDLFIVQDQITEQVVAAIEPHLYAQEGYRAQNNPPESIDAWGLVVRALQLIFKINRKANEDAQRLAREAISVEPSYARAHAVLAYATLWSAHCSWAQDASKTLSQAQEIAERAITLDQNEPWARVTLGHVLSARGLHDQALEELEIALRINPNFALAHCIYGWALLRAGEFEDAVHETGRALRMSPIDDFAGFYSSIHGLALLAAKRFSEALPYIRKSVSAFPEFVGNWRLLASCCGHLGLLDEARQAIARAEGLKPGLSCSEMRRFLEPHAHCDTFVEGLKKAGVPE